MFTKRIIQFSTLAGVDSHEFFMEKYFTSNKRRTFTRHCSSRTFPAVYHTENFQFKPHINAESASFSTPCKPPSQPGFKRIQFNINSVLWSNTFSRINLLPKWAANKTLWLLLVLLEGGRLSGLWRVLWANDIEAIIISLWRWDWDRFWGEKDLLTIFHVGAHFHERAKSGWKNSFTGFSNDWRLMEMKKKLLSHPETKGRNHNSNNIFWYRFSAGFLRKHLVGWVGELVPCWLGWFIVHYEVLLARTFLYCSFVVLEYWIQE